MYDITKCYEFFPFLMGIEKANPTKRQKREFVIINDNGMFNILHERIVVLKNGAIEMERETFSKEYRSINAVSYDISVQPYKFISLN